MTTTVIEQPTPYTWHNFIDTGSSVTRDFSVFGPPSAREALCKACACIPMATFVNGTLRLTQTQTKARQTGERAWLTTVTYEFDPETAAGFMAAIENVPRRDWSRSDDWHRGYLYGRLMAMKTRRAAYLNSSA